MQLLPLFIDRFFVTYIKNSKIYRIFILSDIDNIEIQRKQILAYIFLVTGALMGTIFAFFNYQNQNYAVIIVDAALVLSILMLLPLIKYEKIFNVTIRILILIYFLVIGALLIISYHHFSYTLWLLTVPSVFIFLLGSRWGTGISLLLLSVLIILYSSFQEVYLFEKDFFYRIVFVYLMLLISNLIYEHTRKTVQASLHSQQILLDETIDKLDQQQVEYIKIMRNVNDGIFLLDQDLRIKSPYSTALKNIIDVKFITIGAPFLKILEEKIFKSKLIELEHYLNAIIRTGRIPLESINPLEKVMIHSKKHQEHQIKTLSFSFTTAPLSDDRIEILGRIVDISKEAQLQKKLRDQKTKKIQEMERLMTITKLHPEYLNEFIKSTSAKLQDLKDGLQKTPYLRDIASHDIASHDIASHDMASHLSGVTPNHTSSIANNLTNNRESTMATTVPASTHTLQSPPQSPSSSQAYPHFQSQPLFQPPSQSRPQSQPPSQSWSQSQPPSQSWSQSQPQIQSPSQSLSQSPLLTSILATLHAIKGNASAIGFVSFAELVHHCETDIQTIQAHLAQSNDAPSHYQERLCTLMEKLRQEIVTTETIVHQLGEFNHRYTELSAKFRTGLCDFFRKTIANAKTNAHPPIDLDAEHFDETLVASDETFYEKIKSIFVLLIKNSLAHSIESTEDREKSGKNPHATLAITTNLSGSKHAIKRSKAQPLILTYSDDGKGLHTEGIKQHLKKRYGYTDTKLAAMPLAEIHAMIFHKEFSTATHVSFEAGRGMGMYFVKETTEELGGTITLASTYGSGFRLTFTFPSPPNQNSQPTPS